MEELRSTDILDKEIQSDARKKAENILKKADEQCKEILNSLDSNIAAAKKEKEEFYKNKIAIFEKDQKASIPLEKERIEVFFIQNAISNKINEYLSSLSDEKRISLALKNLNPDNIKEEKLNAYVYGFDLKKTEKQLSNLLGKKLAKCDKTDFGKIVLEEDNIAVKEGVILESENKDFRMRLSLSQVISQLLDKNRAQLSDALFGGQI